jgi:hypothetical protein
MIPPNRTRMLEIKKFIAPFLPNTTPLDDLTRITIGRYAQIKPVLPKWWFSRMRVHVHSLSLSKICFWREIPSFLLTLPDCAEASLLSHHHWGGFPVFFVIFESILRNHVTMQCKYPAPEMRCIRYATLQDFGEWSFPARCAVRGDISSGGILWIFLSRFRASTWWAIGSEPDIPSVAIFSKTISKKPDLLARGMRTNWWFLIGWWGT